MKMDNLGVHNGQSVKRYELIIQTERPEDIIVLDLKELTIFQANRSWRQWQKGDINDVEKFISDIKAKFTRLQSIVDISRKIA